MADADDLEVTHAFEAGDFEIAGRVQCGVCDRDRAHDIHRKPYGRTVRDIGGGDLQVVAD